MTERQRHLCFQVADNDSGALHFCYLLSQFTDWEKMLAWLSAAHLTGAELMKFTAEHSNSPLLVAAYIRGRIQSGAKKKPQKLFAKDLNPDFSSNGF